MQIQPLLQDIADQIKEAQIKLGFGPSTLRLYYTVASVNALTDADECDAVQLAEQLNNADLTSSCFAGVSFRAHDERIEVTVPESGVSYVHQHVEASPFLQQLIRLFAGHGHPSMEDVTAVFAAQGAPYQRVDMPEGSDFDCALFFPGEAPDRYYYFFKAEMGHLSYHRFLPKEAQVLLKA